MLLLVGSLSLSVSARLSVLLCLYVGRYRPLVLCVCLCPHIPGIDQHHNQPQQQLPPLSGQNSAFQPVPDWTLVCRSAPVNHRLRRADRVQRQPAAVGGLQATAACRQPVEGVPKAGLETR